MRQNVKGLKSESWLWVSATVLVNRYEFYCIFSPCGCNLSLEKLSFPLNGCNLLWDCGLLLWASVDNTVEVQLIDWTESWLISIYIHPGHNLAHIIHSIGQYDHIYCEMIRICQPAEISLSFCIRSIVILDLENFCIIVVKYLEFLVSIVI